MIRMRILECRDGMSAGDRLAVVRRACAHDPYEFYRLDTPESEPQPEHLGLLIAELDFRRPENRMPAAVYLVPDEIAETLVALAPGFIRLGDARTLGLPDGSA